MRVAFDREPLLLALWARLGRCPHLTVTLLARLARMLQGALLAQMGRCLRLSLTMLARLAGMLSLALWVRLGCCPHLTVTLLPGWPVCCRGPVGPDGTLSPFIPNHAGPAGRHVAIGPVGPFRTLSPSDCHPAGPAGSYVARMAQMGCCLRLFLIMLARLAGMLLLALWARLGRCPHLLARRARILLGALLALVGRCLHVFLTMLTRLAGILLLALVGHPGLCPRLPPVLRSCDPGGPWWEDTPSGGWRTEVLSRGEIDWEHPGIHRGNLITCAGSERVTDRVCSIK